VRTACKAFARGADEKNGCYGKLSAFIQPILHDKFGARSLPLTPYRGSRFNILFHNASVLYCLHPYLIEFLESNHDNGLTASVLHDLKQPFYMAEVRAFGILSKLFMKPMWAMLEDKDVDILQMGRYYAAMVACLVAASSNPELLLQAESPFPEHYIRKGEFHDQGNAKWIVIRGQLRGHNDTPCGRPTPSRPIGRPGLAAHRALFGGFSNY
jgi:hypothetical protein